MFFIFLQLVGDLHEKTCKMSCDVKKIYYFLIEVHIMHQCANYQMQIPECETRITVSFIEILKKNIQNILSVNSTWYNTLISLCAAP